jgi:phosphoribosyl-ATP pyrophosphohydrolase
MSETEKSVAVLDRLYGLILSRKGGDPATSHTAKLFSRGRAKIAQKVGEEAVETALAAAALNDRDEVIGESADLLFHLLVLWADCGVTPTEVWAELRRREGRSGVDEKKSRPAS